MGVWKLTQLPAMHAFLLKIRSRKYVYKNFYCHFPSPTDSKMYLLHVGDRNEYYLMVNYAPGRPAGKAI